MSSADSLEMFLLRLVGLAPSLLAMLVGMVLALRNLGRHPRPCWALLAALAIAGFNNLGMPMLIRRVIEFSGISPSGSGLTIVFYTLPYSVLGAVSWALIFFAIFDRPEPPKYLVEDTTDEPHSGD